MEDTKKLDLQVGGIYCRRDGEYTAPLIETGQLDCFRHLSKAFPFLDPHPQHNKAYTRDGRYLDKPGMTSIYDLVPDLPSIIVSTDGQDQVLWA